jgi:hypothetical protein
MGPRWLAVLGLGSLAFAAGCVGGADSQAEPEDLFLGDIKSDVVESNDGQVSVRLAWTVTGVDPRLPPHAPVFLFNESRAVEVRPAWTIDPGGDMRMSGTVVMAADQWREGCWRAEYVLPGSVATGPVNCLN